MDASCVASVSHRCAWADVSSCHRAIVPSCARVLAQMEQYCRPVRFLAHSGRERCAARHERVCQHNRLRHLEAGVSACHHDIMSSCHHVITAPCSGWEAPGRSYRSGVDSRGERGMELLTISAIPLDSPQPAAAAAAAAHARTHTHTRPGAPRLSHRFMWTAQPPVPPLTPPRTPLKSPHPPSTPLPPAHPFLPPHLRFAFTPLHTSTVASHPIAPYLSTLPLSPHTRIPPFSPHPPRAQWKCMKEDAPSCLRVGFLPYASFPRHGSWPALRTSALVYHMTLGCPQEQSPCSAPGIRPFRGNRQRLDRYDETDFDDMVATLKSIGAWMVEGNGMPRASQGAAVVWSPASVFQSK